MNGDPVAFSLQIRKGQKEDRKVFILKHSNGEYRSKGQIVSVHGFKKDAIYEFDEAYLLRSGGENLQKMRYEGKYKHDGYSYPKSVIWGNDLYIGYTTNKEDVELTRIPFKSLTPSNHSSMVNLY